MPSAIVSIMLTPPRRIGRFKTLYLDATPRNGRCVTTISPFGRRTAVATAAGERIMTPSRTAWPPTLYGGMTMSGLGSTAGPFRVFCSGLAGDARRDLLVLAAELLDAARRVHQLLLAGVVRMAVGADFDVDLWLRRSSFDDVAADADDLGVRITRVDSGLHCASTPRRSTVTVGRRHGARPSWARTRNSL